MNIWLRRFLILAAILLWLGLMLLPSMAFILARNGQIQVGEADGRHWRLFLLQDAEAEGLGLERGRPVNPPVDAPPAANCLKTTVDYWFWAGTGENVVYCQCLDFQTGDPLDVVPPACQTP